jgi:flagellar biosynthesis GTPase FlhF
LEEQLLIRPENLFGHDVSEHLPVSKYPNNTLAAGDYIREKRNAILCGPTGVGKTQPG